ASPRLAVRSCSCFFREAQWGSICSVISVPDDKWPTDCHRGCRARGCHIEVRRASSESGLCRGPRCVPLTQLCPSRNSHPDALLGRAVWVSAGLHESTSTSNDPPPASIPRACLDALPYFAGDGLGDGRFGHPKDFWAQDDRQHRLEGRGRVVRQGGTASHRCINAGCRKRRLAEDENRCGSRTRSAGAPHSLSVRLRLSSRPSGSREKPIWLA